MFALFNSNNKEFIGYSPNVPESADLLKIEISKDKSDITKWKWEGNYDNGKMVSLDIGYPLEEIEIEKKIFEYIEKNFPLNIQLINIIKQLKKIVEMNDNLQEDSFMDMANLIICALDKKESRIKYYKNYYKSITNNESRQKFEKSFSE
jgi:hypothetical protein